MPLKHFVCPDKQKIEVKDCLREGNCRMGNRCATRSYLQLVSKERPWTGKPSTTQLIQGTMCAFLKIMKEYAISPDRRAFMVHGTKGHKNLEASEDEFSILEERFEGEDTLETGIADVLEVEKGKKILADYKTSGSYKVAKVLGFYVDQEETGEIYKSGKRKGEKKMRNILKRDDSKIDRWEWELQLNKYRIEFEKRLKELVDELRIQCCVRDGNTYIAKSRGVFRNIYYFKIAKLPDKLVLEYFERKRKVLFKALEKNSWSEVCTAQENWDGLKCASYCEVAEFCSLGKYLKREKEEEDMAIKNLSNIRRLPRLGKIRLGIKVINKQGKEYPKEVDYFVFDPQTPSELENKKLTEEFNKLYGERPKQMRIMFPVADSGMFFPQFYKRYGKSTSLQCKGDGIEAFCSDKKFTKDLKILGEDDLGLPRVECQGKECIYYKNKQCSEVGTLQFLLPELPGAGVWQITTGSFHSIVNINSCIDYVKAVCGRAHMIPLTLERRLQETTYNGIKGKHYVLHINMDFKLADLQKQARIEPSQIMLELPAPETEKKDILFKENPDVDTTKPKKKDDVVDADIVEPELATEDDKKPVRDFATENKLTCPDLTNKSKKEVDTILTDLILQSDKKEAPANESESSAKDIANHLAESPSMVVFNGRLAKMQPTILKLADQDKQWLANEIDSTRKKLRI